MNESTMSFRMERARSGLGNHFRGPEGARMIFRCWRWMLDQRGEGVEGGVRVVVWKRVGKT